MDSQTLLIIFVGLTGFAVLLQACVLLALYFTVRKATEAVQQKIDELKANYFPLISASRGFNGARRSADCDYLHWHSRSD